MVPLQAGGRRLRRLIPRNWSLNGAVCVALVLAVGGRTLTGTVTSTAAQAPAIAIVDSGIDATRVGDFGSRIVANVNFSSLSPLATGEHVDEASLPRALVPSEPDAPDKAYEKNETCSRVRAGVTKPGASR